MERKYIGRYRIDIIDDDYFGTGIFKSIYKHVNGEWKLKAIYHPGKLTYYRTRMKPGCELTRAKAYRYWTKYFSGRYDWQLPYFLELATYKEPRSNGVYYSEREHQYIGYEG